MVQCLDVCMNVTVLVIIQTVPRFILWLVVSRVSYANAALGRNY